jgi:hypothetical protein
VVAETQLMDGLIDKDARLAAKLRRRMAARRGSVGTELVGLLRNLLRRRWIPLPGTLQETDEVGDAESLTAT